jgi:hypothetical protein
LRFRQAAPPEEHTGTVLSTKSRDMVCSCGAWNPNMKLHGTMCELEHELNAADEARHRRP